MKISGLVLLLLVGATVDVAMGQFNLLCNWRTEFLTGPNECNAMGKETRCPGVNIFYAMGCGPKCLCRAGFSRDSNLACVPSVQCSTLNGGRFYEAPQGNDEGSGDLVRSASENHHHHHENGHNNGHDGNHGNEHGDHHHGHNGNGNHHNGGGDSGHHHGHGDNHGHGHGHNNGHDNHHNGGNHGHGHGHGYDNRNAGQEA